MAYLTSCSVMKTVKVWCIIFRFSSVNGEGVDVMKQIIQSIAQAHTAQLQAQAQQE